MSHHVDADALLRSQIDYYRVHAPRYDDWWERRGSHDLGAEFNEAWFGEVERLYGALDEFGPSGDVLELAAGTGIWTTRLASHASSITALDASAETLERNARKLTNSDVPVEFVTADIFTWVPHRPFDVVTFAFWLSHVPETRFDEFWDLVGRALRPGVRVFFADNAAPSSAQPTRGRFAVRDGIAEGVNSLTDLKNGTSIRRVADGRTFEIVKVYREPDVLRARLAGLGWDVTVATTDWAFVYGFGTVRERR